MINDIIKTEIEYVRAFSKEFNGKDFIRLWDNKGEDLYANNLTIIKENLSINEINNLLLKEINFRKKLKMNFCLVEFYNKNSEEIIDNLKVIPSRIDKFIYMYINTKNYYNLLVNDEVKIKKVDIEEEYDEAINISILDYGPIMGKKFATYRIKRKILAYKESNNLSLYICYLNNIGIGSCEVLANGDFCKIEDFGILKEFRNKGYGRSILAKVLEDLNRLGVQYAYVVTDSKESAKAMYNKCGFKEIGHKTQLIYDF